jgi:putative N-acetyltransferase (TIGR04045 family)
VPAASTGSTVVRSPIAIDCRLASGAGDLEAHFELRRAVFVREQHLFEVDDRDERDERPTTLHTLGLVDGEPCGAVRLYPLDAAGREWKGDRLAVLPEHRANHLGAALVRFAVASGGRLGGRRMVAHVQLPNVRFFEHLGWRREGMPAPFHGIDHQLMSIALGRGA